MNQTPERKGTIHVVVVAYGSLLAAEPCLTSFRGLPMTVVDNSSSPETAEVARRVGASYIDPGKNLGFAAGVNLALARRQDDDDVLLLNPDANVEPSAVARLRELLYQHPDTACVAPAQHAPGETALDRVWWPFPSATRAWREAVGLGNGGHTNGFVIGSVLLLRAAAVSDIGLFDERFFLYAEEADWQRRACERGWTVRYCDEVVAEHVGAGTGGDARQREEYFHASQAKFIRKWDGDLAWQSYRVATIIGSSVRAVLLRDERRRVAARRAVLYVRNPVTVVERRTPAAGNRDAQPLRVVHVVCTDLFAGVERYVVTVATGLAALGCDVTVIGGNRTQMPRELATTGVRWYPGPTVASATARLWSLGHFDIAHAHMTQAELAILLGQPRLRAKVIATRHFASRRGSSSPARALGRVLSMLPAEQLAISDYVAHAIEGGSVIVAPGVPDVDEAPAGTERARTVLMVQRLEPEKATEVGLEAFAKSRLGEIDWQLVIAGGGAMEEQLRTLAGQLGITSSCQFLGPRPDVQDFYRSAAIFLATRPDEPFGISVVEAMASALPVVCSSGGGHRETVGRCLDAAMFAGGDSDRAAQLLVELAGDPIRRAAYGRELQAIQRERFTLEGQARQTLAVYQSILA